MLKEYLLRQGCGTGRWGHGMPGVEICRFSLPEQEPLRPIPVCGAPLQFEALFCLTGRLTVRALQGTSYTVEAPAIFLLSDSSALCSCQYSGNLGGILIAVDAKAAKKKPCDGLLHPGDEVGHQDRQGEDDGEERLHGSVRHTLDAVIF